MEKSIHGFPMGVPDMAGMGWGVGSVDHFAEFEAHHKKVEDCSLWVPSKFFFITFYVARVLRSQVLWSPSHAPSNNCLLRCPRC